MINLDEVLDCDLGKNDAGANSVREYLCRLLLKLWEEDESFNGKRPFGNSGWTYDLTDRLIESGFAKDTDESYGLVRSAIIEMCS